MKNLITGLLVAALAAMGATSQAAGKQSSQSSSQKSTGGSMTGSSSDKTGSTQTGAMGADARGIIKDWSQVSQQAAQAMLDRYGQPDVVSNIMLVWKDKAPFTRITVTRDPVRHLFPMEHQDVLTEEISLAVPLDKVSELARFDGSILVDRTKGTVAARSDRESSNFLALNLADDIINGKRDAESARKFYSETLAKSMSGKSSAYTDKLNFSVTGDTSFPDSTSMQGTGTPGSSGSSSTSGSSGSSSESSGGSMSSPTNGNGQDIHSPSSPDGTTPGSDSSLPHQGD